MPGITSKIIIVKIIIFDNFLLVDRAKDRILFTTQNYIIL